MPERFPVEALRAVLAHVERHGAALNAFALLDEERALVAARASEARWARGEPVGRLDGVPVSVKDLLLTRGWPTRRRSRAARGEHARAGPPKLAVLQATPRAAGPELATAARDRRSAGGILRMPPAMRNYARK
ncbi:amidase family protein [Sorangium sp. So ce281]